MTYFQLTCYTAVVFVVTIALLIGLSHWGVPKVYPKVRK